jgi:hypothetical protein
MTALMVVVVVKPRMVTVVGVTVEHLFAQNNNVLYVHICMLYACSVCLCNNSEIR